MTRPRTRGTAPARPAARRSRAGGFTLIEMVLALAMTAVVILALTGVAHLADSAESAQGERQDTAGQARFAMQRMLDTVAHNSVLVSPTEDNPATPADEAVLDPGVLSVSQGTTLDPTTYSLSGTTLVERRPDVAGSTGGTFTDRTIATGVSDFRVSRLPQLSTGLPQVVDILLVISGADGYQLSVESAARLGSGE